MKHIRKAALLAILLVLGTALLFAQGTKEQSPAATAVQSVTIDNGQGAQVTVPVNPARVVVLDFGALDILDYAGIPVVGIGVGGQLPSTLSAYKDIPVIGSLHEPDFEKVYALKPDLIIVGGRAAGAIPELNKIAPTILNVMPQANYVVTLAENIDRLSTIFPEKSAVLHDALDEITSRVAVVRKAVQSKGYDGLVVMANDGKLSTFGAGSRFAIAYDDFGFIPSDSKVEASTHGQSSSFEYVAQVNPSFLFVIDRSAAIASPGAGGAAALLDNPLVTGTAAARNGRIVYLDSVNWYLVSGGITSTLAMVAEFEEAAAL
ncbi:siderophore ABC transporter substrate-binding protein [Parasphaerochaeta coccoides]|nr:siderophore ABC transporter substrate-binding protein [Parasphaerochaeta coccoides]